jgi:hypothetical protein
MLLPQQDLAPREQCDPNGAMATACFQMPAAAWCSFKKTCERKPQLLPELPGKGANR